jgi:uncharacterized protein YbdZ (MbtH family)
LRKKNIKKKEIKGGWRKVHNEELKNRCSSSNDVTMMRSGLQ